MRRYVNRILTAGALSAASTVSPAHATSCDPPPPLLEFTYPNASTREMPLDAVFWVYAADPDAHVRVLLDGMPLEPLGDSGTERFQFVPREPLSPGNHSVYICRGVR